MKSLVSDSQISDLAKLTRDWNIAPIYLPGEASVAPFNPVAAAFLRLSTIVQEQLAAMDLAQLQRFTAAIPAEHLYIRQSEYADPLQRLECIAECYLVAAVSKAHADIRPAIYEEQFEDRVLMTYPELRSAFDKDGLLTLDSRFELRPGGIFYKEHIFQFHQFLRRGFHSNPNADLIGSLSAVWKEGKHVSLRLAIDRSRLMPLAAYREIIERDYWWGPHYEESRLDESDFVGMTVLKRKEGSILERLFAPIERTEFFWHGAGVIKTLEIEEVSRSDAVIQGHFLNRYVHAERDTTTKVFRHLDGAVKIYEQGDYARRIAGKLSQRPKSIRKPKLFRLDGKIAADQLVDIVCQFYKSNEMLIEYFNPAAFEKGFGRWNVPYATVRT